MTNKPAGPAANPFQRDRYRKRLAKLLAMARDEDFFQMVWAIDALQSGRSAAASGVLNFPPEAATSEIGSEYAVHRWVLETLIGELLTIPKSQGQRFLKCSEFSAVVEVVNTLRDLENIEAGIYLKRIKIFPEMHRIAQRQFPWQQGFFDVPRFYRYAYIYGNSDAYFAETHGLTLNQFSFIGFCLYASFEARSWLSNAYSLGQFGIDRATMAAGLRLLCTPLPEARNEASKLRAATNASHGAPLPVAYQPSLLRQYPIVLFDNQRLRSPLRGLIAQRVTSGVYYDLVKGPEGLRNEAARRFEEYVRRFIPAMLPRFSATGGEKYQVGNRQFEMPDILVKDHDRAVIAMECKATKLSFAAQYSDDPIALAKRAYDEIAKGVYQLWRYFSHLRRGVIVGADLAVVGVVLTLDTWLTMSQQLQDHVCAAAVALINPNDGIDEQDRRTVAFCHIQDLEAVAARTDEDGFLRTINSALEDRFKGWALPGVRREIFGPEVQAKRFPLDLDEVLPWWRNTEGLDAPERRAVHAAGFDLAG